jgi:Flp pilus assembly protein TadG
MKSPRLHTDESAQGLIEFALLATILLYLFAGTVDFARFMYFSTAISSAARVGAEAASNPCDALFACASYKNPNDYVMQATKCEDQPYVTLKPAVDCGSCLTTSCASNSGVPTPCVSACSNCVQDICIYRADVSNGAYTTAMQSRQIVTVTAGYQFTWIAPIIGQFFPTRSCYTDGSGAQDSTSNQHNMCATATGRVY